MHRFYDDVSELSTFVIIEEVPKSHAFYFKRTVLYLLLLALKSFHFKPDDFLDFHTNNSA